MPVNLRDPSIWGPPCWKTLHYIAYSYPDKPSEDTQNSMLNLLSSMADLLPCPDCQRHCSEYFRANPPVVCSRSELMAYLVVFHNSVNSRTGKPELHWDEAKRQIENWGVPSESTNHHSSRKPRTAVMDTSPHQNGSNACFDTSSYRH